MSHKVAEACLSTSPLLAKKHYLNACSFFHKTSKDCIGIYAGWLPLSTPLFFSISRHLTFFPAESFCQVESIKTVHLSAKYLFAYVRLRAWFHNCTLHVFVWMCEFVVFSNVCAQTFSVVSVDVYVCMCRGGGWGVGGSPGAWQYGAVMLHTPPVKMPPMGPGQLWPTYTDSWAITSLMTHTHTQTYTHTHLPVWLGASLLLSFCKEVSHKHKHSSYLKLFLMDSIAQETLFLFVFDSNISSSIFHPLCPLLKPPMQQPDHQTVKRGCELCVKGIIIFQQFLFPRSFIHRNVTIEGCFSLNFIYLTVTRWWDTFS